MIGNAGGKPGHRMAPEPTTDAADPDPQPGRLVIAALWATTVVFAAAAAAAVAFVDDLGGPFAVISLVLFGIGCALFVRGFLVAADRSRREELSVAGLLLLGAVAPKPVRYRLWGALAAQTVVALVAASLRPFTELAFGVLVPMVAIGAIFVWSARHGDFPLRSPT